MPKVTIWIREDDKKTWNAIKDRPEWLHMVINHPMTTTGIYLDKRPIGESYKKSDFINKALDKIKENPSE